MANAGYFKMNAPYQQKEHFDYMNNVIDLATARQGLIGGPTIDENWLKALEVGTVFLSKKKSKQPVTDLVALDLFCVLEHKVIGSNLMQKIPTGQQVDLWFESLKFSRANELVEVIATVKLGYDEPEKQSETTDGTDNRPVRPGRLVDDAPVEG